MAFVRWRGNRATLLATIYEPGGSRQIRLANLGAGYGVSEAVRQHVTTSFPDITVDWEAVNRAMAKGPAGSPPLAEEQYSFLTVENLLREWAHHATPFPQERAQLRRAADVLRDWRVRQGKD